MINRIIVHSMLVKEKKGSKLLWTMMSEIKKRFVLIQEKKWTVLVRSDESFYWKSSSLQYPLNLRVWTYIYAQALFRLCYFDK